MCMRNRAILMATKFQSSKNPWDLEPLGGLPWPPRAYACSFCRREFRSAQALGGHMNVHRRDRARLKQSSLPQQAAGTGNLSKRVANSNPEFESYPLKQVKNNILVLKSDACDENDQVMGKKLSVGMSLNFGGHDYGGIVCKKVKRNGPLFCAEPYTDSSHSSRAWEAVDLELRLGDPPVVKLEFHC